MDKQEEKKLEAFVDKIMADTSLESPSPDFTKNLMQRIEAKQPKEVFQYRPILSRPVKILLFVCFIGLFLFLAIQNGMGTGESWFNNVSVKPVFQNVWGWFGQYTSSKIVVYSVLLFGLLFFVQVPLLKRQLDKKLMLD